MANNENLIPIPGRLHSVATEGHVSGADEIYDDTQQKDQETINSELIAAIGTGGSVDSRIAAAINALDSEKSQTAGADGLALSVTEVNGKITSISGSIAANTYDVNGAAATVKTEVIGGATSSGNTLKKLEDRVSPLETAVGSGGSIDTRISNAVAAEATAREAADTTLGCRIDTLEDVVEDCAYIGENDGSAVIADFDPQTDTVWKKAQTLSNAEKEQIQQNIGIKEWLNNLTGEKFASYTATDQTTAVTDVLPATGATDTVYRVGKWDGSAYNEEYYSDYAWDGSAYVQLNKKSIVGEVFDISEYHADAKYADLAAALDSNNGGGVPQSLQKGGMSVKFVSNSDNKYVQFFCTADDFTTDVTKWQGVDDEPIAGSDNLVKSGGVKSVLNTLPYSVFCNGGIDGDGHEIDNQYLKRTLFIKAKKNDVIKGYVYRVYCYNANKQWIGTEGTSYDGQHLVEHTITNNKVVFIKITVWREFGNDCLLNGKSFNYVYFSQLSSEDDELSNKNTKVVQNTLFFESGGIGSDGVDTPNNLLHRTSFLKASTGDKISGFIYRVYLYDENGNFLGSEGTTYDGYSSVEHTILTNNAYYVRITLYNQYVSEVFLVNNKSVGFMLTQFIKNNSETQALVQHLSDYNNPHHVNYEQVGAIGGILLGSTPATKENGIANIPNASVDQGGLMSASDKQKLDSIVNPGSITIQGSGVYKNANAYGFLPSNDGDVNAENLQSCLSGGGTIVVDVPGTYQLSKTLLVDSNTTIFFGSGVNVELVDAISGNNLDFVFLNRGALTGDANINVTIDGLHLNAGTFGGGGDVMNTRLLGQRGYIAMKGVSNLVVRNTYISSSGQWYNIHIQEFKDILLENITVESTKDGIHLGVGKCFTIKDCNFKTEDDAIALNAQDYYNGTSMFGWIEDGIIQNIRIYKAPNGEISRGIYSLGGAWLDWASGNTYRKRGDTVVSNGGVYVSWGNFNEVGQSTIAPTHSSGIQTYSDGFTWGKLDNPTPVYNAGVKNIKIDTVFIEGNSTVITIDSGADSFTRSVYPGATPPIFENYTISNVFIKEPTGTFFMITKMPVKAIKIVNCEYKVEGAGIWLGMSADEIVDNTLNTFLICGMTWNFYNSSRDARIFSNAAHRQVQLKIIGSLEGDTNNITPWIAYPQYVDIDSDITVNT